MNLLAVLYGNSLLEINCVHLFQNINHENPKHCLLEFEKRVIDLSSSILEKE